MLPSATGGANWPGGAFDPETKMLYVYSATQITGLGLVPPRDRQVSDMRFIQGRAPNPAAPAAPAAGGGGGEGGGGAEFSVQGLPLVKPPYGRITAFNMNTGDMAFQIAHGETPDNIRNHAALKGVTVPRTGRLGRIGKANQHRSQLFRSAGLLVIDARRKRAHRTGGCVIIRDIRWNGHQRVLLQEVGSEITRLNGGDENSQRPELLCQCLAQTFDRELRGAVDPPARAAAIAADG